jgi:hypothetical protein
MYNVLLKLAIFITDLLIMGYCGYIAFFKADPTLKDLAFIGFIILVNVMSNQSKLESIQEKLK